MFFRRLLPALLWALFILVLCGIPGTQIPKLTFLEWLKPDKIVHLVIFGVQSVLVMKAFAGTSIRHPVIWTLLLSAGYGILIEVLQETIFIKRNGDVRDALANIIGALLGVFIFQKRFRTRG